MRARIEQSFQNEKYLDQALVLAYGHRAAALLKLIGWLMIDIGLHAAIQKTGKYEDAVNWIQVPFALDQTAKGVSLVFEALQDPDAGRSPPTEKTPKIGEAMARGALVAIKDRDAGGELADIVRHVVIHEIGHHLGFSDEDMERIEQEE